MRPNIILLCTELERTGKSDGCARCLMTFRLGVKVNGSLRSRVRTAEKKQRAKICICDVFFFVPFFSDVALCFRLKLLCVSV